MSPDVEIRERVARLETKLDYIIEHMSNLPPSPETIRRLEVIETKAEALTTFTENLKGKLAIAGAGFMLMGSVLLYVFNWVINHVSFGSN